MGLPVPKGRQKDVLYLPAQGHFAVLGTAGSGKTTLAILRSAYLADPATEHGGKVLLVTFNRALVTYLKYLGEAKLGNVVVENYHKFALGYLNSRGKNVANAVSDDKRFRDQIIGQAVRKVASEHHVPGLLKYPVELYSEEIKWISQNGIMSKTAYEKASQEIPAELCNSMFDIYTTYTSARIEAGKQYDWDDLANAVYHEFGHDKSERRYKHIVIDEGQDFSPQMIKSLIMAASPDGSITFFGDVAQQIYGHKISWRSAGLHITNRGIWYFKENYRNTKQIAQLGLAISKMPYFVGIPDIVEPVSPSADGPLPTLVKCSSIEAEIELAVSQAVRASRTLSVAILCRNRQDEELISSHLPQGSIRLHKRIKTWQSGAGIMYGTYHSAKGLEFDMVILPFCNANLLPDPKVVATFGEKSASIRAGKLLYVGVTRARTRLIITFSKEITNLLPRDPHLYRVASI